MLKLYDWFKIFGREQTALSSEDKAHRIRQNGYFLPIVEMKDDNVIIDGRTFFHTPAKKS